MKSRSYQQSGNSGLINLYGISKNKNIRRKEKNNKNIKFIGINDNIWQTRNNKKHLENPFKIKNKNREVKNFKLWNNNMIKAMNKRTNSFIKSIFNLSNFGKKVNKNKKWKIVTNKNKFKKNIIKHNKNIKVLPKIITDMSEHINNSIKTSKLSCIENINCYSNEECGINGSCYNGKCRCKCKEFSSCISNSDCPGSKGKCISKCIGKNGTAINCGINYDKKLKYDNLKGYCSRGSQCLSGICIGGGRKKVIDGIEFYEAISCSTSLEDISCKGIGIERCTIDSDLIFRHTNQYFIGTKEDIPRIDMYHMKINIEFPTCFSGNNNFVQCGEDIEDSCIEGAYCGYCKC
uniref:EB domain-containing protein n=1 Tax=Strongyloides stercoralis TaxID=6248 RepID=A0A0K0EI22_STRER